MLDVHPPHEPVHTWRDFLLHLATITIGLLIALGLEGCVEWMHHRHLVHQAETSLRTEIENNDSTTQSLLAAVHKQQSVLQNDVALLNQEISNPKVPVTGLSLEFRLVTLDEVSWKTAQTTGAIAYMPYARAQEYAEVYDMQEKLNNAQEQGVRDTVMGIGLFANPNPKDPGSLLKQYQARIEHIEVVQGQLFLLESLVKGLDAQYKKFLSEHHD